MEENKGLLSAEEVYQQFLEKVYLEEKDVIVKNPRKTSNGSVDMYVVALVNKSVIKVCTGFYHHKLDKIVEINSICLNSYDLKDIQKAVQGTTFLQ